MRRLTPNASLPQPALARSPHRDAGERLAPADAPVS